METTLTKELTELKKKYPHAVEYILQLIEDAEQRGFYRGTHAGLPKFDDNDEMIEGDCDERRYCRDES